MADLPITSVTSLHPCSNPSPVSITEDHGCERTEELMVRLGLYQGGTWRAGISSGQGLRWALTPHIWNMTLLGFKTLPFQDVLLESFFQPHFMEDHLQSFLVESSHPRGEKTWRCRGNRTQVHNHYKLMFSKIESDSSPLFARFSGVQILSRSAGEL